MFPFSSLFHVSWQVGFFDFFGRKLNSWDVGISCNSKSLFFVKNDKGYGKFFQ